MLSALGVVLLYLGVFIQVVDLSMAVIASLLCVVALIEYGKGAAWSVFGVTALLSLLLLTNKSPAFFYAIFFGYYPIIKERIECLKAVAAWCIKEAVFNVALAVSLICMKLFLAEYADLPIELFVIGIALAEAVFVLYDIAITRMISLYVYKLRGRIKFK